MAEFKQDMPPPGGYAPITYKRVPLKKGFLSNAKVKLAGFVLMSGLGWLGLFHLKEKQTRERIEMRCVKLALLPMLHAEADRAMLKQLKKNRDMEEEIMKDVKGWQVGKWKNSPVYLTIGPDDYFRPCLNEYYAHAPDDAIGRLQRVLELY